MQIEFEALVKQFKSTALQSLDKGFEVRLIGESPMMVLLAQAPADKTVKVKVEWEDGTETDTCNAGKAEG